MQLERSGGVLLHPTSLPGGFGIGDIGPEAHRFIDWLSAAGCGLWQVLPLGPTGIGNSPYQCHSVFAGNPNLISPELLVRDGLLAEADLIDAPEPKIRTLRQSAHVDFGHIIQWKTSLLRKAYEAFKRAPTTVLKEEFARFRAENADWLDDFGLFMAAKERFRGLSWINWPAPLRERDRVALAEGRRSLDDSARLCEFTQMLFFRQWRELRRHARDRGIRIIGDVPIFAAEDSSDVWAHREMFLVDATGHPTAVAGVPPDYFSPKGQLWGNPLYRWAVHKESAYSWWQARLRSLLRLADIVRLDHFRGLAGYWAIPVAAATAETGEWMPGPGTDFLDALVRGFTHQDAPHSLPIIAEDLGVTTPDVVDLLQAYDLPNMRVIQFGFTGPDEDFLPHNYPENCVAYTGTHDNDTTRGWFASAPDRERQAALRYLGSTEASVVGDLIRAVWSSRAALALVPVQDLLDLGTEARMNFPGKPEGNWEWRLRPGELSDSAGKELRDLNLEFLRLQHAALQASQ